MEALYEKKRSYTVHGYINLGNPLRDKPMRKMSVDDLKLFQDMMLHMDDMKQIIRSIASKH